MIIGASDESDYTLVQTTQKLYQNYDLKRVFYSAYIPVNEDSALPSLATPVPLLREHRLYQSDWLHFDRELFQMPDRPGTFRIHPDIWNLTI